MCLMTFRAHMIILLIVREKILGVIKWSYRSSSIMLTIEGRMVTKIWAYGLVSYKYMSLRCAFLHPRLTTNHSNVAIWFRVVVTMKGSLILKTLGFFIIVLKCWCLSNLVQSQNFHIRCHVNFSFKPIWSHLWFYFSFSFSFLKVVSSSTPTCRSSIQWRNARMSSSLPHKSPLLSLGTMGWDNMGPYYTKYDN